MSVGTCAAPPPLETLVALLRFRASEQPENRGFTFLRDGEQDEVTLTYGELDRFARAIAAELRRHVAPQERAILLFPPGLEYVAAFFGCLYAGVIAVPVYPPEPLRLQRTMPRLQAIFADAKASVILTSRLIASLAGSLFQYAPELKDKRWVVTDALEPGVEDLWQPPSLEQGSTAFLQYTSGSTGTPKGVQVSHGNLLHNLQLIGEAFGLGSSSTGVIWLPPYHDMGLIGGILEPLYHGFPVVLMSPLSFLQRPARWVEAISRYRATCSGGPNFAFDLVVRKTTEEQRASLDLSSWDVAFCGAEPIRRATFQRFADAFAVSGARREAFFTCYGLAEGTLIVTGARKGELPRFESFDKDALAAGTARPCENDEDAISLADCGRPVGDWRLAIVDPETGARLGPGQIGEIWIAGTSATGGYWSRPDETARTFGATLDDEPGYQFVRTGDLGFRRDDRLFVTGRLKDLIIVRGRNHYPQDIEQTIESAHSDFRPGCSAAFAIERGDEERLVVVQEINRSYRTEAADAMLDAARSAISEQHEINPYDIVLVAPNSIPKTSSGKIQRHACKNAYLDASLDVVASSRARATVEVPVDAATSPRLEGIHGWLAEAVSAVLGVGLDQLEPDRPLTAYGLDSMQAIQLQSEIEAKTEVSFPISSLLGGARLRDIARALPVHVATSPAARRTARSSERAPCDGERALWFMHRLAPESAAYNICRAVRLRAPVDVDALHRAFQDVCDFHPALRTTFPSRDGIPMPRVATRAQVSFIQVDASGWAEEDLRRRMEDEAHRPFDLQQGPLLRVWLFRRPGEDDVLLLCIHHIVIDFWSLAVLARDVGTAYQAERLGRRPQLDAPALEFGDWVEQQALSDDAVAKCVLYWQQHLGAELPVLDLLPDRRRPATQTYRGHVYHVTLDAALTGRLQALSRQRGTTLFATLLSGVSLLLHRCTGQNQVIIGTPTAGRKRASYAQVLGYFVDPIPLRLDVGGDPSFVELMDRAQKAVISGLDNQMPFARLVEHLQPVRDPARSPLFQVAFALHQMPPGLEEGIEGLALDQPGTSVQLGDLHLESFPLEQRFSQFDLSITMAQSGGKLGVAIEYNSDLFEHSTIERLAARLNLVLEAAVRTPEDKVSALTWLLPDERRQVILDWNSTEFNEPANQCLHTLLTAQAAKTPNALAVSFGDHTLTYEQLEAHANRLACRLVDMGVGAELLVAVHVERSIEAVVAVFGVLKAGGAFLLLDPAHPRERLAQIIEDSGARLLITHEAVPYSVADRFTRTIVLSPHFTELSGQPNTPPNVPVLADNLAYVIFTSGSTGQPKGVMVTHRAIVNRILWGQHSHPLGPEDAMLLNTSFSFDVSVWELFASLLSGGATRLVITPPGRNADMDFVAELIAAERVTTIGMVPSALHLLLESAAISACTHLRHVFVGGESLPDATRDRFFERLPHASLYNFYGLSETAVDATHYTCVAGDTQRPTPIGMPIGNMRAYILDALLEPVGVGIPGELFIGGIGLARGYLGRPDLTAERFLPDPFSQVPSARLYCTGDRARWRADGNIEFIGRRDQQIKLRGVRIELGEVEALVRSHPAVQDAVVVLHTRTSEAEERALRKLLDEVESLSDAVIDAEFEHR